jgi:hypothetical protein
LAFVRLRTLSEAEAYARCYGDGDDNVRFVTIEPRRRRLFFGVSGEDLRRAFESRLQHREVAHETGGEALGEAAPDSASGAASGAASSGHKPAAAA